MQANLTAPVDSRDASAPVAGSLDDVAVVAIGRNEGDRLVRCLRSVVHSARLTVYVDSGSTDGSVATARALGVEVVELDMSRPFTAARARNAGFAAALRSQPDVAYIQFVDGDCEVDGNWLATAQSFLSVSPRAAAVFGRCRERHPDESIYNRLCDMEWDVPPGSVKHCGGNVMMRVKALDGTGGYRDDLIAGEEPELCVRLRREGWQIHCLAAPMVLHDAAMTTFRQWWRRATRAGYAFANGAALHGGPPEYHWVTEVRRNWLWALAIPAAILLATIQFGPAMLLLTAIYPLQVARLYLRRRQTSPAPLASAVFNVIGYFAGAVGQLQFRRDRLTRRQSALIEYK